MGTMKMRVSDNLHVEVRPNEAHEYLMTTKEVAKGFGISPATLRRHKMEHSDELFAEKHFVKGVTILNDPCLSMTYNDANATFWTKRGIVRLGFFIKSERARLFRDWAEDLIIGAMEQAERITTATLLPEPTKRKHNRLTPERMVDILVEVAKIDDKALRISLTNKLTK